jgi:hypothetical protein
MYMRFSGMRRAYYLVVNKNDDTLYSERIAYQKSVADEMLEKARRIITAPNPPAKISDDPTWWKCRFCDHSDVCHSGAMATLTCRTCLHATAELDGDARWSCNYHKKSLTMEEQAAGCSAHRYIPSLVTFASPVDASADSNWVEYELKDGQKFRNGDLENAGFTSADIARHGSTVVNHRDAVGATLLHTFNGSKEDAQTPSPFDV